MAYRGAGRPWPDQPSSSMRRSYRCSISSMSRP